MLRMGHYLAAFSPTLLEKRLAGSQTFLYCPLLVRTTSVVGIGCVSVEEILMLGCFSLSIPLLFRRPIFVLIINEAKKKFFRQ